MDAYFGIIMLAGKYLFLGLLYWFIYWLFRGLFADVTSAAVAPAVPSPVPARPPASSLTSSPRAAAVAAVAAPITPAAAPVLASTAPAIPAPGSAAQAAPSPAPVSAVEARPPAQAALLVKDPGQSDLAAGQVLTLSAAVTLGRAADNGIVLHDKYASQHHAMIFLLHGQRMLRDRDSTNGVYHNGQRIIGDVELHTGDQISIGSVAFEYRGR